MATVDRFNPEVMTTTIASSGTTSSAINLSGLQLVAIDMPAAVTGTTMTFSASTAIDGTYDGVQEVGGAAAYSVTMTAGKWTPVDIRVFAGVPFLKIISGSSEAATRTFNLICRPVS
jgi:hypothetical protein